MIQFFGILHISCGSDFRTGNFWSLKHVGFTTQVKTIFDGIEVELNFMADPWLL
jgi:hypothetical protein